MHCNTNKESNHITGVEWVLLLINLDIFTVIKLN